jgi:hypothetical protein
LSKIIPIKSNLAINYIIFSQQNYPLKIKSLTTLHCKLWIIFFISSISGFAQSELDSLLSIDFSKLIPKKRVETLINTSRAYYKLEKDLNSVKRQYKEPTIFKVIL